MVASHQVPAVLLAVSSTSAVVDKSWTMDFRPGDLKVFIEPTTGDPYWYFTYVVVNNTGNERMWAPSIELFDGAGKLMPTGRDVPGTIHDAIQATFTDGAVDDQFEVLGKLPIGEENGKEGLCVWKASNLDSTDLTIFVKGISSELKRSEEVAGQPPVMLRRSMRLDFKVRADERMMGHRKADQTALTWVFR